MLTRKKGRKAGRTKQIRTCPKNSTREKLKGIRSGARAHRHPQPSLAKSTVSLPSCRHAHRATSNLRDVPVAQEAWENARRIEKEAPRKRHWAATGSCGGASGATAQSGVHVRIDQEGLHGCVGLLEQVAPISGAKNRNSPMPTRDCHKTMRHHEAIKGDSRRGSFSKEREGEASGENRLQVLPPPNTSATCRRASAVPW